MRALLFFFATFISFKAQAQSLVDGVNNFAFRIYQATKPDSVNFVISPFGLNTAIAIAAEGARSSTKEELNRLLSATDFETNMAASYDELLTRTLDIDDSSSSLCLKYARRAHSDNKLYVANSLWISDAVAVNGTYKSSIVSNYHGDLFQFSRDNVSATNKKLDDWGGKSTGNHIKDLPPLNTDIRLSILNAIYFVGEWDVPFSPRKTKSKKFHTIDRKKVKVGFMRMQSAFEYFEDEKMQVVRLPYQCDQFSLMVILPIQRYGILDVERMIDHSYLRKVDSTSQHYDVVLSLPKFRIETEILPANQLKVMGFGNMFSDEADFSGISETESLKVGSIFQKTMIELDENRTEAAAVSKVEMVVTGWGGQGEAPARPVPKVFTANHPFIFLLIDNRTNAVIFAGRFVTN